jgi:large subunit ribosomal protein L18
MPEIRDKANVFEDKRAVAKEVGRIIGQKAKEKGIKIVAFDRGGYLYHGRVKALADAAREAGLVF